MNAFFVQSVQIAYFLGSIDLSDRLKVAEIIRKEMNDILDGTPTILPIPDGAPLEIPRIILSSKNGEFVCKVAISRYDFIHRTPERQRQNGIEIKEFEKELPKRIKTLNRILFEELHATSHRLGLILNYTAFPKKGGLNFLKDNFLGNLRDISSELQLHKLTQGEIQAMKINNWIRLIANKQQLTNGDNPLLIISDINTFQTEKYEIDSDLASKFYDESLKISLKTTEELLTGGN